MATIRAKDGLRKEKKVATPSSSPKPAIATNSDHKLKSSTPSSSSSSAKPVPNYLKPTLSSKSESLKVVKKTNHSNNEDPAQKQLLRRRSFDRPPSFVRPQSSLISSPEPKERVAASRIPNNRPSSASTAHTTAYYRPVLDRNAKSLKPVRSPPQQVHRPVSNSAGTLLKRSKSLTKNNNSHSSKSPSSSIPPPPDETQDLNLDEINQEPTNNESLVQESTELEAVNNVEDMDVAEDSQVKDGGDVHHHEDGNIKTAETSIVEEVSSVVSDQVEANEIELRHEVVDQDENIQEELEHQDQKEERDENQLDDTKLVDNQVIIDDRKEEENIINEKAPEEESEAVVDETKNEERVSEEVKLKNEEPDVQEVVAVENRVEEGNEEVNNNTNTNNSNATQNKKQPAAYNDVIEETKNKLLEKRKNKVKALVGAFETVIDYETAAGSNK